MALMDRLLRFGEGKILKQLKGIANQVNSIEEDFVAMSDDELIGQTADFKARYEKGETLESLLPEAFATVREASKRVLDKRHFDVQIMGGAALHLGNIAEMKTGEGKTLVATLPSYLNAHHRQAASTSSRSTTTWPSSTRSGWAGSTTSSGWRSARSCPRWTPRSAGSRTTPTSPTAPTTSSASTTCATTWRSASRTASSASTTSRSWTRSTRS